jgi:hypothetical protein
MALFVTSAYTPNPTSASTVTRVTTGRRMAKSEMTMPPPDQSLRDLDSRSLSDSPRRGQQHENAGAQIASDDDLLGQRIG